MSLKQQNKDNKLASKYYIPYKVLQRIGSMAYKLELHPSSCVYLVFHFCFLNKETSDKIPIQTILPKINEEGRIILEPKTILEKRTKELRNQEITEYLIRWKNLPVEEVTKEGEFLMHKHPHIFKYLGHDVDHEGKETKYDHKTNKTKH